MKRNTICYKVKNPVVYNKGTKYERSCDTFLLCYTCNDDDMAHMKAMEMTMFMERDREKFAKDWHLEDVDNIDYFFVHKQEEMY